MVRGTEGLIITLPTLTQLGCIIGAAALGYGTTKAYIYLSEITDEEVQEEKKGRHRGKGNKPKGDLPRDEAGSFIPAPAAHGDPHTTLGTRKSKETGSYTQGATFGENEEYKGRTDVTNPTVPQPIYHKD